MEVGTGQFLRVFFIAGALACTGVCVPLQAGSQPVSYGIVYVRQPRFGENQNTAWPEIFHPGRIDPVADLMLLHPDGSRVRHLE